MLNQHCLCSFPTLSLDLPTYSQRDSPVPNRESPLKTARGYLYREMHSDLSQTEKLSGNVTSKAISRAFISFSEPRFRVFNVQSIRNSQCSHTMRIICERPSYKTLKLRVLSLSLSLSIDSSSNDTWKPTALPDTDTQVQCDLALILTPLPNYHLCSCTASPSVLFRLISYVRIKLTEFRFDFWTP